VSDFKHVEEQIGWLVLEAETPRFRTATERQKYADTAKTMQALLDVAEAAREMLVVYQGWDSPEMCEAEDKVEKALDNLQEKDE
jgi:hypothetical protein